ncbi:hypothetical protein MKL29_08555 [Streptococcus suis]|nr:hypothetical protein [Streptococcus suis]
MKKSFKKIVLLCSVILSIQTVLPSATILANDINNNEDQTTINQQIVVTDTELIINGKTYSEQELEELLETAIPQPRFQSRSAVAIGGAAAYAGSYFIPGVGQVLLLATGIVIIGGVTIYAGHWAANTIRNFFGNEDNMTANDIISNRRKAGIRQKFPGEYLHKTYKEIKKDAKAGKKRARTAKKLLEDGRFKK